MVSGLRPDRLMRFLRKVTNQIIKTIKFELLRPGHLLDQDADTSNSHATRRFGTYSGKSPLANTTWRWSGWLPIDPFVARAN